MTKALFFNIPTHGHINPTLPLVRALVRGGHQITYFAGPSFAPKIEATGAAYGDYGAAYTFEGSRTVAHAVLQGSQLAQATNALLPAVLLATEQQKPDYIIFDMSAAWGNIAAQRFDLPSAASFPHLPFNWRAFFSDPRVLKKGLFSLRPGRGYYRSLQRRLRDLAREHNLRKPSQINILASSADLNIVFSSRLFQPNSERFDSSYHFIGPVINTDRPHQPWPIPQNRDRKLVYIAVGTLYQADLQFFHYCLQAFADQPLDVILSVGKSSNPADLEPLPPNFQVAQYVPQLTILDHADLFITHGGLNSINEAVLALVPMVVIPNTVEQAVNALRVEQLGVGRYLEPAAVTAQTLRDTATAVLHNKEHHAPLQHLRQSFLTAGGIPAAVTAIETLIE